jgi:hypothetical protein
MQTKVNTKPVYSIAISHNKYVPPKMALKIQLNPSRFMNTFRVFSLIKSKTNTKPNKSFSD